MQPAEGLRQLAYRGILVSEALRRREYERICPLKAFGGLHTAVFWSPKPFGSKNTSVFARRRPSATRIRAYSTR